VEGLREGGGEVEEKYNLKKGGNYADDDEARKAS
jgi:hypothetical protein